MVNHRTIELIYQQKREKEAAQSDRAARAEPYVLRDMMRKCAADASQAVRTNALLLDDPRDQVAVAIAGAGLALGTVIGLFINGHDEFLTPDAVADILFGELRPVVLEAAAVALAEGFPKSDGVPA